MRTAKRDVRAIAFCIATLLAASGIGSWFRTATASAHVQFGAESQTPAPSGKPTKRALLIGINNYKYPDRVSPLAGSLNDVEDMRQLLDRKV